MKSPWLPGAGLAACLLVGFLWEKSRSNANTYSGVKNAYPADAPADGRNNPSPLLLPTTSIGPRQVVETQMRALSAYAKDQSSIHQVFAFASPANRAVTGPIDRFEIMILHNNYRSLLGGQYLIGEAVIIDDYATVLVSSIGEDGTMTAYRFYLSKQKDEFVGCWMTDGVFPSSKRTASDRSTPSTAIPPKNI